MFFYFLHGLLIREMISGYHPLSLEFEVRSGLFKQFFFVYLCFMRPLVVCSLRFPGGLEGCPIGCRLCENQTLSLHLDQFEN